MKPIIVAFFFLFQAHPLHAQAGTTQIALTIVDRATRQPIPCRVHLKNALGRPVLPESLPGWRDHFVCLGKAHLELPAGVYSYEIERGPEYSRSAGSFNVSANSNQATAFMFTSAKSSPMKSGGKDC